MITVQMGKTSLQVCGHAGFSRYGSDIVCAAASMLAFALAEAVQTEGFWTPPVVEAACGTFRLEVRPEAREQGRRRCLTWFARDTGFLRSGIRHMCGF